MKDTKKRVMTVILAAAMLTAVGGTAVTIYNNASISVSAAENKVDGQFDYVELDDGTVEITGSSIVKGELEIPSKLGGKTVSKIGYEAFEGKTGIRLIVIPGTVKTIASCSFSGCTGVQSLTISDGVEVIEGGAFQDCSALKEVVIPDSVTEIGNKSYNGGVFGG